MGQLVTFVLMLSSTAAFGAESSQTICELLLVEARLQSTALESFKSHVQGQSYTLDAINPNARPEIFEASLFRELRPKEIQLTVDQNTSSAPILLRFSSAVRNWVRKGPRLKPIKFWVRTKISPEGVQDIVDELGAGLLHHEDVLNKIHEHVDYGGLQYGVMLDEFPDGSRSFISFGFNRAQIYQVTLGLDVPCPSQYFYVNRSPPSKDVNEWQVIALKTEDELYCRIPVAVFTATHKQGGAGRI